jgi:hypothetical protein
VYYIKSLNGKLVWVGSKVTVLDGDARGYAEYSGGRLITMCERRKDAVWFVFKDDEMGELHFVEIKNEMVKWPIWYKLLSCIDSFQAYIHHIRFGHQLPF